MVLFQFEISKLGSLSINLYVTELNFLSAVMFPDKFPYDYKSRADIDTSDLFYPVLVVCVFIVLAGVAYKVITKIRQQPPPTAAHRR